MKAFNKPLKYLYSNSGMGYLIMFFNANVPGTGKMTWTRAVQVKRH